jgi:PAS domain S-box-containing protein
MNRGETCPIEILLVEDSPSDALLLQESLLEAGLGEFDFTHVECWADAAQCLRDREFDVLLLDLSLPDVAGQETFLRARAEAPHLPIMVLTGTGNEALGLEAVRHGIQDYLVKGQTYGRQTARTIRYAIERKRAEEALEAASEQRRLALEAAGMGAWDYHFDTGDVFGDERCRNQWGIAEGGQIDYAVAIAAIHAEDRAATDEAVKQALAGTDGGRYHREFRVVWPDGAVHWIDSRGQVYFEGEGERRRAVRFIGANQDITERKAMAEAQEFLSRCGCQDSESFFRALARYLGQSLGMDFVCIDRLAGDEQAALTLAMYYDGKFEDNVAYALKDTPCGQVVGQTICCFPKDVRHLFPKDAVLQELKAESYVGTTLWSFDRKPIGLIAVIGRKPLVNPGLAESVLKLVAVRAAGELERMLAEVALRESEARLKMAQQAGRIGTFERNLRTGEITWSEYLEALYGLPAGGFEGSYAAWQQRVLAADRPAVEAHLAQAVARRGDFQFEYRVVWPDGTIHWVTTAGKVVTDERGEPTRTLGVSMDITERKRAEEQVRGLNAELEQRVAARTAELRQTNDQLRREIEVRRLTEQELSEAELRYRTVADFTYDWEYWKTPEGLLLYCSPSCERVTGYTNLELAVSPELLAQIIHPHDRDNWQRHEREAMAHPALRSIVFRIQRKDKELRWIEHTCQPVIGSQGEFLGLRASNHDVTERKQAEMDMQQLRKELAHVTRVTTAGQLAASLAHELNQPLTAIRCNAETAERLLATAPPNVAEAREALDDIERDSERAGGVIQGLRALFNKTSHERSVVQINDIIYGTLDLLRSEFALKGITAEVHLEPTLPKVLGNRIELQQVVLNLVANAIDAMSECETGLHHLNIATVCEGSREIHVSVGDSGPGIQVQPISRLFEPFFTTKTSGMGMGLAISQSILVAHGGSLGAVNNPDRGATFHFTLPVHHGEYS